jgi:hypothetical protein
VAFPGTIPGEFTIIDAPIRSSHGFSFGQMAIDAVWIDIRRNEDDRQMEITISMRVPDVRDPMRIADVHFHSQFPTHSWDAQPDRRPQLVRAAAIAAFTHELDEWLKYNGQVVSPPEHR